MINLKELVLVRTLLYKWSDYLKIIDSFPLLEILNLSENLMYFDEEFSSLKKELYRKEFKLKMLILNKMKMSLKDLMSLSFTFRNLTKLYLYTNNINEEEIIPEDQRAENYEEYYKNIEYLCVDNNRISCISKLLAILNIKSVQYLNLNQNNVEDIYNDNDSPQIIQNLQVNIKGLYMDINNINDIRIMNKLEKFRNIHDLNILSNPLFKKIGIEKSKFIIIGRLPKLENLNNTYINKQSRRDHELLYLKYCVEDYLQNFNLKPHEFIKDQFENYAKENHSQYFVLRKKYYDPVEEILELKTNAKSNNIKSNSVELKIQLNERQIVKKFPKNLTLSNMKNVILKLFKISSEFQYILLSNNEENLISDESKSLEFLEVIDGDILKLKLN